MDVTLKFKCQKQKLTLINSEAKCVLCPKNEFINSSLLTNVSFQLLAGTSFYGTGEASGPLERTGKRVSQHCSICNLSSALILLVPALKLFHFHQVFTWNTDTWDYSAATPSLYQSRP